MSDNEKWVWSNEDDPIPALFRPEPSASKADPGLHLDLIAPETAKTPRPRRVWVKRWRSIWRARPKPP